MPDPVSNTDPLTIPVPGEKGTQPMAAENENLAAQVIAQGMAQLAQSGVVAQNNFITTNKAQDFDYLEGKRLVSLEEAVGVREVSSKEVPAGPANANAKTA